MRVDCLFLLFFFCCSCSKPISEKKIAIQPFGKVDQSILLTIQKTIKLVYEKDAVINASKKLPKSAFINIKSPRYRADSLIKYLKINRPDSIDIVLGFTTKDISTTKRGKLGDIKKPINRYQDWGVFGLGYRPGPSCIVSSHRLGNTAAKNKIERIKKVCIHEIGHNLGLKHCPDKKCVMTDACESIKTVDNVKLALCKKCKSKIE